MKSNEKQVKLQIMFTLSLLSLVLLSACSRGTVDSNIARRDPNTGKVDIKRNYALAYSERNHQSLFKANFREGKDIMSADVRLISPASIKLNGKFVPEDSKIDKQDGGELAAFYIGFIFPPAWMFMGDNGYVNYVKRVDGKVKDFEIEYIDPEGEIHRDYALLSQIQFSVPNVASKTKDLVVPVQGAENFDWAYCGVEFEQEDLVEIRDKNNNVTQKTEIVKHHNRYYASANKVRIPARDLQLAVCSEITVECGANSSDILEGGSGGNLTIDYIGMSYELKLGCK
ncbi:MAG: hypothetical protein H6625_03365 [Bdellovibrionaceae bacterium]|nr:hypothetical protein [Pseudobdellovibrionaceae bacterium]